MTSLETVRDALEAQQTLLHRWSWRAFRAAGVTFLALLIVTRVTPDLRGPLLTLTLILPFALTWMADFLLDLLTEEN